MERDKRKISDIFKNRKTRIISVILIAVFILAGVSFLVYPSITNYFSSLQQARVLEEWNNSENDLNSQIVDHIQKSVKDDTNALEPELGSEVVSGETDNNEDNIEIKYSSGELDYTDFTAEDFFPAKITIPAIELEWIVNEGTDTQTLRKGPGHIIETVLPGDLGRCAISGHRTTYGAPFNRIDELQDGDLIHIETKEGLNFTYALTSKVVVSPQDVYVLDGAEKKELILTSCEPKYSAAKRLVVISELLNIYIF